MGLALRTSLRLALYKTSLPSTFDVPPTDVLRAPFHLQQIETFGMENSLTGMLHEPELAIRSLNPFHLNFLPPVKKSIFANRGIPNFYSVPYPIPLSAIFMRKHLCRKIHRRWCGSRLSSGRKRPNARANYSLFISKDNDLQRARAQPIILNCSHQSNNGSTPAPIVASGGGIGRFRVFSHLWRTTAIIVNGRSKDCVEMSNHPWMMYASGTIGCSCS